MAATRRINDLAKTEEEWRHASGMHCGSSPSAGWSDAVNWSHARDGRSRLGYVTGLLPSSLRAPCQILQWHSKFTRKLAESRFGGGVYAISEIIAHVASLREF